MKDESLDKYREWVAVNYSSDPKEQLFDIYKEAMHECQEPHGRVAKTIAKACTLIARLSHDQERVHRSIRRLTLWLVILTVVLSVLTLPLVYHAYLVIKEHHQKQEGR